MFPTVRELEIVNNQTICRHDKIDYSNVICTKPWGFEFQIYETTRTSIWYLNIKRGHMTSLHCHFKKDTFIIILRGCAKIKTVDDVYALGVMESMYIPKNKFHALGSFSPETVFMEIEIFRDPNVNFSDKNDLLRIDDQYNRKPTGYETSITTVPIDERHFRLAPGFSADKDDVHIRVHDIKDASDKYNYNIVLEGEYYQNGSFFKEGTIVKDFGCIHDSCLVLSLHKPDWREDCKIIYDTEHLGIVAKNKEIVLTSG